MLVFKCNNKMDGETWARWRDYIESKHPDSVLLPESIDFFCDTEERVDNSISIDFTPESEDESDEN